MLRKISFGLLCLVTSFTCNSYAGEASTAQQESLTIDYDLPPNVPLVFSNYVFWTIEATCTMITEDQSDMLQVVALAKKGKINDRSLESGQSLQIEIHPYENLRISAESGAKVEITNLGEHVIKAHCST